MGRYLIRNDRQDWVQARTIATPTHKQLYTQQTKLELSYRKQWRNVTDGRTDRQTDRIAISIFHVSVLTRDKKQEGQTNMVKSVRYLANAFRSRTSGQQASS